jgi:hypothetical protein
MPIESVVASIEIKLALDAAKFQEADAKASEVAQLRLRPTQHAELALSDDPPNVSLRSVSDDQWKNGVAAADPAFVYPPVVFALFAFDGKVKDTETVSRWLDQAKAISLVCCLNTGCVYTGKLPFREVHEFTQSEEALTHFVECLVLSVRRYTAHVKYFKPDYSSYAPHKPAVRYARSQGGGDRSP